MCKKSSCLIIIVSVFLLFSFSSTSFGVTSKHLSSVAALSKNKVLGLQSNGVTSLLDFVGASNNWEPTGSNSGPTGEVSLCNIGSGQVLSFGNGKTSLFSLKDNAWGLLNPTIHYGIEIANGEMIKLDKGKALLVNARCLWLFNLNDISWTKVTPNGIEEDFVSITYLDSNRVLITGKESMWIYNVNQNAYVKKTITFVDGGSSNQKFSTYTNNLTSGFYLQNNTVQFHNTYKRSATDGGSFFRDLMIYNIGSSECHIESHNNTIEKLRVGNKIFGYSLGYSMQNTLEIYPHLGTDVLSWEKISNGVKLTWGWTGQQNSHKVDLYKDGQIISSNIPGTFDSTNSLTSYSFTDTTIQAGTIARYKISFNGNFCPEELMIPYCP